MRTMSLFSLLQPVLSIVLPHNSLQSGRYNVSSSAFSVSSDLEYGPEFGVNYRSVPHANTFFDDTKYLVIDNDPNHHRELSGFECTYQYNIFRGKLASIRTMYRYDGYWIQARLRGFTPFVSKSRSFALPDDGTSIFNRIDARVCDGLIHGIAVSTNRTKNLIECGEFQPEDDSCTYPFLLPPMGRRIVGLYGDAQGSILKRTRGVRGIGLITMANPVR